jgi:hypothetical protein
LSGGLSDSGQLGHELPASTSANRYGHEAHRIEPAHGGAGCTGAQGKASGQVLRGAAGLASERDDFGQHEPGNEGEAQAQYVGRNF